MTNAALTTFLLELSARAGAEGLDPRTLGLRVRSGDLADHLRLTPEELERSLSDLDACGIIDFEPGSTVTILDRCALETASVGRKTPEKAHVPRDQTESALRTILADERFLSTPRTSALLVYLVEQAIADGSGDIDVRRIATEVLGKASGFDPRDPTLRVLVTHLRKMLDEYDTRSGDAAVSIRIERGDCRVVIEPRETRGTG